MATLTGLLRPIPRRMRGYQYKPFSQPRYRGGYSFLRQPGRFTSVKSNAYPYSWVYGVSPLNHKALPLARPTRSYLTDFEDRRLWSPYQVKPVSSLGESYYRMVDSDVMPGKVRRRLFPDPRRYREVVNPNTGEIFSEPRVHHWHDTNLAVSGWTGFEKARHMVICLKRRIRREVMHALGLSGKVGQKSPTFGPYSRVRC